MAHRRLTDDRGNMSMLAALAIIPLMGAAGAAIDYVRLYDQQTKLATISDAAVLAAITAAQAAESAGKKNAEIILAAKTAAQNSWGANAEEMSFTGEGTPVFTIEEKNGSWSASASFDGAYPTSLMSLLGIGAMSLKNHSVAAADTSTTKEFWQINLVVDTSNSMGIGATKADMDALQGHPQIKCSFACHFTSKSGPYKNTVAIAHDAGITLRIDIVDNAIDALTSFIENLSDSDTHIKTRLVGLDRDAEELVALTPNVDKIRDYSLQLTEAKIDKSNMSTGDTNYEKGLETVTSIVGKAEDGSSAAKPKKAVFFVTDGVHDSNVSASNAEYTWTSQHHLGPIDAGFCDDLKKNDVTVGVLYINYIKPYGFQHVVDPYESDIIPRLKACADDGLFENATSEAGITKALQDMLKATMTQQSPRLTQ